MLDPVQLLEYEAGLLFDILLLRITHMLMKEKKTHLVNNFFRKTQVNISYVLFFLSHFDVSQIQIKQNYLCNMSKQL